MAFTNTYKSPSSSFTHEDLLATLKEPYDLNSNIPVPSLLQTSRLSLVPFIPSIHSKDFFEAYLKAPALEEHLPIHLEAYEDGLAFIELMVRRHSDSALFAIIDKTRDAPHGQGKLAGMIGWLHASPEMRSLEIGPVIILPNFQGSFVSSNAIGLVMKYALDLPSEGGLGFRRVVWCAAPANKKSIGVAEKLGFKQEGVMRWVWVLPEGKAGGRPVDDAAGRGAGNGRDSVMLSITWEDWAGGAKDSVQERMDRK